MDRLKAQEKFKIIQEITDLTGSFMPAQIVLTANRLELFSTLAGKKLSAEELAETLETEPRATGLLCNALTALGFLVKENNTFNNSPKGEEFLVQGRSYYIGDNLRHQATLWQRWSQLTEVIKTGRPLPKQDVSDDQNKQQTREFTLAMANIGQLSARKVVEGLDMRGVKKIIDIGGGPGTYAMEMVKQNPAIQAIVFDQLDVVLIAEERIRQNGLSQQVATIAGDCFADDFGSGYDLAFLSNFIHIFGLEEIVILFKKVWSSLNTGGRMAIKDFFVNEDRSGPVFATQFALNMLLNTEKGNTYSFSEIQRAFDDAGFQWLNSFDVGQHSTVIVGEKIE
ncbi:MAG: methyltransferase [bacterium]